PEYHHPEPLWRGTPLYRFLCRDWAERGKRCLGWRVDRLYLHPPAADLTHGCVHSVDLCTYTPYERKNRTDRIGWSHLYHPRSVDPARHHAQPGPSDQGGHIGRT